jgi:hypothetical protein
MPRRGTQAESRKRIGNLVCRNMNLIQGFECKSKEFFEFNSNDSNQEYLNSRQGFDFKQFPNFKIGNWNWFEALTLNQVDFRIQSKYLISFG